jgi:hypothetical protein
MLIGALGSEHTKPTSVLLAPGRPFGTRQLMFEGALIIALSLYEELADWHQTVRVDVEVFTQVRSLLTKPS